MSADSIYFWANWALVGALVVGLFATWAIILSGNARDRALRQELAAATKSAAKANEHYAELLHEMGGRHLTTEQRDKLVSFLKSHIEFFPDGKLSLGNYTEPETYIYVGEIVAAFEAAGIRIGARSTYTGPPIYGIAIRTKPEEGISAQIIKDAFDAAGIDARIDPINPPGFVTQIAIGPKPPP